MKQGEICIAAAGSGYVGKPRPVVVIQGDLFDATTSVTVSSDDDMTRLCRSIAVFLGLASS